jgi:GNAT superfamily N-acetyltransferase
LHDSASVRFVAVLDARIVAYAHTLTHPAAEGGRAGLYLWVDPAWRDQGIGSALWKAVLDAAQAGGLAGLRAEADVSDQRSLAVALAHGLVKGPIRRQSMLDLTSLRTDFVADLVARTVEAGVQLVGFEPTGEADWREFYEVFLSLHRLTPDSLAGREPPPYDTVRQSYGEPWQVLLAHRGAPMVGMTMAFRRPDRPLGVTTFFTGVASVEQGRGIGIALKAEHARRLGDDGWRELFTWNMEENLPILAANARLGFAPVLRVQSLFLDLVAPTPRGS